MGTETTAIRACRAGVVGGQLVVEPAVGGGDPCRVVIGDGVSLVVDGQRVHDRCDLTGTETVEVVLQGEPGHNVVEVALREQGLEAVVTVTAVPGTVYGLVDVAPAEQVTLRRSEPAPAPPAPLEAREVTAALSEAHVTHGVLVRDFAPFIADPYSAPVVLARGTEPGPSADAVVRAPAIEAGRNRPFHCVRQGDVLATKTPAVQGADGVAVTGAPIPARTPADPPLAAGDGATAVVADDGSVLVTATRDGKPVFADGELRVNESTSFNGDIDVATGDVVVYGSLTITGGIDDRRVFASGSIEAGGGNERAQVTALGGVTFTGPLLNSVIVAGLRHSAGRRLAELLEPHVDTLRQFCAQVTQLRVAAAERGTDIPLTAIGPRVAMAFPALGGAVTDVLALLAEIGDDVFGQAMREDFELAQAVIAGQADVTVDPAEFGRVALHAAGALRRALTEPRPDALVAYLQNSRLEISGDLTITGQGAFTSDLVVGGDLKTDGSRSTIRGGVAEVGGEVRVAELGGHGGARTLVVLEGETTTPDRLKAEHVHPGVRVHINGLEVAFEVDASAVVLGVDAEGHITGAERATVGVPSSE